MSAVTVEPLTELAATSGFRGEVIGPTHGQFDARRRIWNGLFDRRPAVILRATDADDVRRAVGLAEESAVPLAIRCGGHSFPGHSTCDDGILLDLSLMSQVPVDGDRWMARVGGGALLADVDAAGRPHDLVVPAGVVSHTGTGGLTLGGGMGWNSRRYGLTIDNLQSVNLVLADGTLLKADEETEPDPFWAVRGGGGNFGVVTNFEFRMRPLDPAAVATSLYPAADAGRVLLHMLSWLRPHHVN